MFFFYAWRLIDGVRQILLWSLSPFAHVLPRVFGSCKRWVCWPLLYHACWMIHCSPNFSIAASAYHVLNMEDEPESDDLPSYNRMAPQHCNTLPNPFKYLSLLSGTFNLCSGLVRLHLIRFLQLDTILINTPLLSRTWLTEALGWLKAAEDKWLVVLNDWTSLFLAVTFLLAACFNYATFAVLVRKDRRMTTIRQDSPGQQEKVIMNVM